LFAYVGNTASFGRSKKIQKGNDYNWRQLYLKIASNFRKRVREIPIYD
jgi:hypothetical protein